MAIGFVGDIHGQVDALRAIVDECAKRPEIKAVIQVGDLGWYQHLIHKWRAQRWDLPVYWIHGNHEEFPLLRGITEVTEVCPNLFYVPNGTVLELDGRKIAFCGGAASVDKNLRQMYGFGDWWDDENIRDEDLRKFEGVESVDIFVTHCPPQSIIQKHFDPMNLVTYFNLPITWKDPNADKIEAQWKRWNYPLLLAGHMHKKVTDYQCRILQINELFCM